MNSTDKSDPKPDLDHVHGKSTEPVIRRDLWLDPSVFYEDIDDRGNNRRMPSSLRREFVYEPNILTEKLVRLQRLVHQNHKSIDNFLECSISGVFWSERQLFRIAEWTRNDAPGLLLPTTDVLALGSLAYATNRSRPPAIRGLMTVGMGIFTGFWVYPSWRRQLGQLVNKHIVEPIKPVQRGLATLDQAYNRTVEGVVRIWDTCDNAGDSFKASLKTAKDRIVSIFKPGRL